MRSPTNKKAINKAPATKDAFSDCMVPALWRKLTIKGMLPTISITANKTKKADKICSKSKLGDQLPAAGDTNGSRLNRFMKFIFFSIKARKIKNN